MNSGREIVNFWSEHARLSRILYGIFSKLKLMPKSRYYSARSAYLQHYLVKNGIVGHGILVGIKK